MTMNLLIGAALLTLGRKLFWLFVGGVGFLAGVTFATRVMGDQTEQMVLMLGIIGGLMGAALVVALQKMALSIAGFIAGGYVLVSGLELLNLSPVGYDWLMFLVGGVLGALLISKLFEWGLILLSSLAGAVMLVQALPLEGQSELVVSIVVFVIGVAIQTRMIRGKEND